MLSLHCPSGSRPSETAARTDSPPASFIQRSAGANLRAGSGDLFRRWEGSLVRRASWATATPSFRPSPPVHLGRAVHSPGSWTFHRLRCPSGPRCDCSWMRTQALCHRHKCLLRAENAGVCELKQTIATVRRSEPRATLPTNTLHGPEPRGITSQVRQ